MFNDQYDKNKGTPNYAVKKARSEQEQQSITSSYSCSMYLQLTQTNDSREDGCRIRAVVSTELDPVTCIRQQKHY